MSENHHILVKLLITQPAVLNFHITSEKSTTCLRRTKSQSLTLRPRRRVICPYASLISLVPAVLLVDGGPYFLLLPSVTISSIVFSSVSLFPSSLAVVLLTLFSLNSHAAARPIHLFYLFFLSIEEFISTALNASLFVSCSVHDLRPRRSYSRQKTKIDIKTAFFGLQATSLSLTTS